MTQSEARRRLVLPSASRMRTVLRAVVARFSMGIRRHAIVAVVVLLVVCAFGIRAAAVVEVACTAALAHSVPVPHIGSPFSIHLAIVAACHQLLSYIVLAMSLRGLILLRSIRSGLLLIGSLLLNCLVLWLLLLSLLVSSLLDL